MLRNPFSLRASCLVVVLALGLAGGNASARGSKKRSASQGTTTPASASPGKKHPAEVHLSTEEPSEAGGSAASASAAPPSRGPTRIDFDDRLIQGQTNKSGAVYLYERKELKTRSMVKKRESFRDEIVSSVYDG
jgi:hypothetical protein